MCSFDHTRIRSPYDALGSAKARSASRHNMVEVPVSTPSARELLSEGTFNYSPARYVQIDAEGHDDLVLSSLLPIEGYVRNKAPMTGSIAAKRPIDLT